MEKTMASLQAFLSFLPRAPNFPLPLPLLTPATQARWCRVRMESREKITIRRNRKKKHFMNCTMRGRGGKRRWINYNMDLSCFPLHTAQVALAIYIKLPSFGIVKDVRIVMFHAEKPAWQAKNGTSSFWDGLFSFSQNLRCICCEWFF